MPDASTLLLFAAACLALDIIPGPAVLYIVARSLHQGRRAGLASVLGVQAGGLVHVLAATAGLSALLMSSALAFTLVKYAGAAYLVYLGIRTLLERHAHAASLQPQDAVSLRGAFLQGMTVNILNPKTALFFLAFLPQFVQPERGPVAPQVLLLGLLFVLIATVSDGTYALLAEVAGRYLRGNTRFARKQQYVAGGIYLTLGALTAVTGDT